jgi:alanine dehydrogenase
MHIGIPREIKTLEGRVALVPDAFAELARHGHRVLVEQGAGRASGYDDEAYRAAGAEVVAEADALYAAAELIVKVKEPVGPELERLRPDHLLFSYLHLAANPALLRGLLDIGLTAVAFETVAEGGALPLLAPMSDVAGRIATQVGAHLLHAPKGGKGLLLGGLPGAARGHVVVLGAGVAGGNAARVAADLGARVTVFDRQRDKLEHMRALGPNVTGLYPFHAALARAVAEADLFVGAVLIPGAKAPRLVGEDMVRTMQPGSVVVDISIDQGGCVETIRPTTWAEPTFEWEGVVHFGVTNMPGAVPRSASQALSASLLPYVLPLAAPDWREVPSLAAGVNVAAGQVVHPALLQGDD